MPSQRSARYPLRSQDIHVSPDHIKHETPAPTRSRMLDSNPQMSMPSLVDPAPQPVSSYFQSEKYLLEGVPLVDQKSFLEWQGFEDAGTFYQDLNQTGPAPTYPVSSFENFLGNSAPNHLVEPILWDYATSYIPSAQSFPSSTFQRSMLYGDDTVQDPPIPPRHTRSRPYAVESEHQKFASSFAQQRRLKYPHANSRRATPITDASGKPQHIWSAEPKLLTLPTTKLEILTVSSPDMNRGCEGVTLLNRNDAESDMDPSENAEPYAQLIYRALRDAPGYGMVLKDIYDWFEKNTDKAKNPLSKGWQNSIRHNLSMNGAFKKVERIPPTEESKKGYIWVLEKSALEEGVKSTTRYRKHHSSKNACKSESPAPQRQLSGAKGGKAARKTGKIRRHTRLDGSKTSRHRGALPLPTSTDVITEEHSQKEIDNYFASEGMPYYLHNSNPLQAPTSSYVPNFNRSDSPMSPLISDNAAYQLSSITACTPAAPDDPLFYEVPE